MKRDKKPYRFLVIEDNPGDFLLVKEFLLEQMLYATIVHAVSYRQATGILKSDKLFSAILLDLSLPDKGREGVVTDILHLASTVCPIIILTGYTDTEFSIKSISQGILDYLPKEDLTAAALYKSIIYSIEIKKRIEEIKASEKRYSDLFNLSPQPMWVSDPDTFQFVQVNQATIDLYGYTEEEFLAMKLEDILDGQDVATVKQSIKDGTSNNRIQYNSYMNTKKSGELLAVEIYSNPIVIGNRSLNTVIAIDVTEKKLHDQKIIKAIIKTQDDERYEIGGELHDNVCQILASSQLSLGMLKNSLPQEAMHWWEQCREYILLATDEIRNLSHRLAPAFLEYATLEEAITILLESFNIGNKYEIEIHVDDTVKKAFLPLDLQLNLYRILQEQLKNIYKYAQASVIEVDLLIFHQRLKMRIADDGVGFNIATAKRGIGMANMKRRAELFSGKFNVESSPGNGCVIMIDIPITDILN